MQNGRATAIKCVDKKYVKFLSKKGFEHSIPFVSDYYVEIMSVPLSEFGDVTPADWFLEISHGVDWASKNITSLDTGDLVSIGTTVFMYVPVGVPGSIPLTISSKLAVKQIKVPY